MENVYCILLRTVIECKNKTDLESFGMEEITKI